MGQIIERANDSVENGVRLSTFVWAQKAVVDGGLGLSTARAASLAKNVTVNFNRKGEWGSLVNSLYMFANAGIQGNARLYKGLKRSKKIRRMFASFYVAGFMLDLMNRILGGDDEETGIARWDLEPEWEKERNLILLLPKGTTPEWMEDKIKFPLGWGINLPFYAGGQTAATLPREYMGAGKPITKAGGDVMVATLNNFNPLGNGTLLQTISPTVIDPVTSSFENKRWTTSPIRPEQDPYRKYDKPRNQLYWGSVHPTFKAAADWWNELWGGDAYKPGRLGPFDISVSPEDLEEWFNFLTAGPGRFLSRTYKVFNHPALQVEAKPFVRRFFGGKPDRMTRDFYYNIRGELYRLQDAYDAMPADEQAKMDKRYQVFLGLADELIWYEGEMKKLRSHIKEHELEQDSAEYKQVRSEIDGLRNEFLREYFEASEGNLWWQY